MTNLLKRYFLALTPYAALVLPFLILAWVWYPPLNRYTVLTPRLSASVVEKARNTPSDEVLDEVAEGRFELARWRNNTEIVGIAESLLRGNVEIPGLPSTKLHLPFDSRDVNQGPQSWQLENASLIVPDVLLNAYEVTHDDRFLRAARDVVLGWARYERSVHIPRGFLWNDHAMAARVSVLVRYWRLTRNAPDDSPENAQLVLQFVLRTALLLSRPQNFTVTTNHGVMENIALLQICVAFPALVDAEKIKSLAISRLREQLEFYFGPEGIVLEHSLGYHSFGLHLLRLTFRYLELLHEPLPKGWTDKYSRGLEAHRRFSRPDGTLPMVGDTGDTPYLLSKTAPPAGYPEIPFADLGLPPTPDRPDILYPVSGYAVWWDGLDNWPEVRRLSQVVVAWTHFPGLGHKHSDETSVLFWGRGRSWWTNVGYWSYDDPLRLTAESWEGSNAPHLVHEPSNSVRNTQLLSSQWSASFAMLDLLRTGPGGYSVRRQVLQIAPRFWIVVDATTGDASSRTTTTWNAAEGIELVRDSESGAYSLRSGGIDSVLHVFLFGPEGMTVRETRGGRDPLAGWQVVSGVAEPTAAIVTEQAAADGWSGTVWTFDDTVFRPGHMPQMLMWNGPEHWRLRIPVALGSILVTRDASRVSVLAPGKPQPETVSLVSPRANEISKAQGAILKSHDRAMRRFPKARDLLEYRLKITWLILVLTAFEILAFFFLRRKKVALLHVTALAAWIAVWIWLAGRYFAT